MKTYDLYKTYENIYVPMVVDCESGRFACATIRLAGRVRSAQQAFDERFHALSGAAPMGALGGDLEATVNLEPDHPMALALVAAFELAAVLSTLACFAFKYTGQGDVALAQARKGLQIPALFPMPYQQMLQESPVFADLLYCAMNLAESKEEALSSANLLRGLFPRKIIESDYELLKQLSAWPEHLMLHVAAQLRFYGMKDGDPNDSRIGSAMAVAVLDSALIQAEANWAYKKHASDWYQALGLMAKFLGEVMAGYNRAFVQNGLPDRPGIELDCLLQSTVNHLVKHLDLLPKGKMFAWLLADTQAIKSFHKTAGQYEWARQTQSYAKLERAIKAWNER